MYSRTRNRFISYNKIVVDFSSDNVFYNRYGRSSISGLFQVGDLRTYISTSRIVSKLSRGYSSVEAIFPEDPIVLSLVSQHPTLSHRRFFASTV
jgi:hypothetical protein